MRINVRSFLIGCSSAAVLLICCTNSINPFTNPDNVRVSVAGEGMENDTIRTVVDTNLSITVSTYLINLVDQISVSFGDGTVSSVNINTEDQKTLVFDHEYLSADTFMLTVSAKSGNRRLKEATYTVIVFSRTILLIDSIVVVAPPFGLNAMIKLYSDSNRTLYPQPALYENGTVQIRGKVTVPVNLR